MSADWKIEAEKRLMQADSPEVLSTSQLQIVAGPAVPRTTFLRWVDQLEQAGKLQPVIKGVYMNRLGHRDTSVAAAADFIRQRSVVTGRWVLEQAGVTNNFGGSVTCVIPTDAGLSRPNVAARETQAGEFHFYSMPISLVNLPGVSFGEHRDVRFTYPRTTPEKAFLDWLYLAESNRASRPVSPPPMDLEFGVLAPKRLMRLAVAMDLTPELNAWRARYEEHQEAEAQRQSTSPRLRL